MPGLGYAAQAQLEKREREERARQEAEEKARALANSSSSGEPAAADLAPNKRGVGLARFSISVEQNPGAASAADRAVGPADVSASAAPAPAPTTSGSAPASLPSPHPLVKPEPGDASNNTAVEAAPLPSSTVGAPSNTSTITDTNPKSNVSGHVHPERRGLIIHPGTGSLGGPAPTLGPTPPLTTPEDHRHPWPSVSAQSGAGGALPRVGNVWNGEVGAGAGAGTHLYVPPSQSLPPWKRARVENRPHTGQNQNSFPPAGSPRAWEGGGPQDDPGYPHSHLNHAPRSINFHNNVAGVGPASFPSHNGHLYQNGQPPPPRGHFQNFYRQG
jgi:hypothetical protein